MSGSGYADPELATAVRKRIRRRPGGIPTEDDMRELMNAIKPIEEWDLEELARGRPRTPDGTFSSKRPTYIQPLVRREVARRLPEVAKSKLQAHVSLAITTMASLLKDNECDESGRPIVPSSVKLEAAKYIIDQTIGKPTTSVRVDTGDQLRGLLAAALVNPDGTGFAGRTIEGELADDEE